MDNDAGNASLSAALAKAPAAMGKALKQADNPHFRSKYADLSNVMDACLSALNANGLAMVHRHIWTEHGPALETLLLHTSGESMSCAIPIIVGKNDMQGLGSAITYARRYGAMCLTGIAPEDDDGNAAAASVKGRPVETGRTEAPPMENVPMTEEQFTEIRRLIDETGTDEDKLTAFFKMPMIEDFSAAQAERALTMLAAKAGKK